MLFIAWMCSFFWAVCIGKAIIRWVTGDDGDRKAVESLERDRRPGSGNRFGRTSVFGRDDDEEPVRVYDNWIARWTDPMAEVQTVRLEDRVNETTTGLKAEHSKRTDNDDEPVSVSDDWTARWMDPMAEVQTVRLEDRVNETTTGLKAKHSKRTDNDDEPVSVSDDWTARWTDPMAEVQTVRLEGRVNETTTGLKAEHSKLTSDDVNLRINLQHLGDCIDRFDNESKSLENSEQEIDNYIFEVNHIENCVDDFGDGLMKTKILKHESVTTKCLKALSEQIELLRVHSDKINGIDSVLSTTSMGKSCNDETEDCPLTSIQLLFDNEPIAAGEKLPDAVSFDNKVTSPAVLDWLEVDRLGTDNAWSMLQRAGLIVDSGERKTYLSEDLMPIVKKMINNIICTKGLGPRTC